MCWHCTVHWCQHTAVSERRLNVPGGARQQGSSHSSESRMAERHGANRFSVQLLLNANGTACVCALMIARRCAVLCSDVCIQQRERESARAEWCCCMQCSGRGGQWALRLSVAERAGGGGGGCCCHQLARCSCLHMSSTIIHHTTTLQH